MWLSVLTDALGRVLQVGTMIGDNGELAKVTEVLSPFTTALLLIVGIHIHLLIDRDQMTSSGQVSLQTDSLSH